MIWCVEDDASIRDIELYTLRSVGFETRGFPDANEFFEALKNEKPSLILLDVMLPGMDGVEVLQKLKSAELCLTPPRTQSRSTAKKYSSPTRNTKY